MRPTRTFLLMTVAVGMAAGRSGAQEAGTGRPASAPVSNGYANPIPPGGSPYTSPYANPFANPTFNPYLNPYMTAVPVEPEAALLYFLAAQRASGGIGSGRPSGVRAAQEGTDRRYGASSTTPATAGAGVRGPALMPRSVAAPGSGAERYFGRLPDRGGAAADYYSRNVRRPGR